jgi:L-ascorbate 6-phosphate lactonase
VTHEHVDHIHPPSYGPLLDAEDGTLYAPEASFSQPDYDGDMQAPQDQRSIIEAGDVFEVGDLTVRVRDANDPDAIEPVSFVVEQDSRTFFHAGDSRPAEVFGEIGREFDIIVGALALGSVGNIYDPDTDTTKPTRWYNDENQVIEAARTLRVTRLLPSHWDMWRGVGADPTALYYHLATYEYLRLLEVVTIGDRIDVEEPGIVQSRTLHG